jgi:glycosyltransferase involved in cell wall biosynthesis
MSESPRVSAVIPVYNGELYVAEAIRSVLEQTHPVAECIVVDDGSVDATADVVTEFGDRVVYVRQDNAGVSIARNRGAALASGEFLAFLDHDDVWMPSKLERELEVLHAEQATMVTCAMLLVDGQGAAIGEHHMRIRGELLLGMLTFDGSEIPSCSSTGLIRRADFHRLGGFDPRLGTSADWDLLLNVLLRGNLSYIDEPLARYRVHASNMSRSVAATERDMRYAFRKAFADPALPASARRVRRVAYSGLFRMLAGSYLQNRDLLPALRTGVAALLCDPLGAPRRRHTP